MVAGSGRETLADEADKTHGGTGCEEAARGAGDARGRADGGADRACVGGDAAAGNGVPYTYTYDVQGRLMKVEENPTSGTPTVIAEYRYDANHQRIAFKNPTRGGGATLEAAWHYPVYDHRWRMIEVRRDESSEEGGSAQARHERFYYHNAGLAGGGGSGYIDNVIRRDRNAAAVVGGAGRVQEEPTTEEAGGGVLRLGQDGGGDETGQARGTPEDPAVLRTGRRGVQPRADEEPAGRVTARRAGPAITLHATPADCYAAQPPRTSSTPC